MPPSNRKVLLVDDQADSPSEIRSWLEPEYEVHVAGQGAEALRLCREKGPFAVVVSDFARPGTTGIELFSELREHWPDTLCVMLTGCSDLSLALEALEQGAIFRFLTRPANRERLLSAIGEAVTRFAQHEQELLFTEQLVFVQESLQAFNESLGQRLDGAQGQLSALEAHAASLARACTLEEVLERTTESLRGLLGARAPEVHAGTGEQGLIVTPGSDLRPSERRALAILESSSRLASEKMRRQQEAEEAKRTILLALEALARYRDDETGEHLVRVSEYSRFLAEALRTHPDYAAEIDQDFVDDIARAAPLHDIGKVAIPDVILFKPGKLDAAEWEIMRTHAQVGADILKGAMESSHDAGCLRLAHELAGTHHERWDGQGYPRGLAGTQIPLAGRIMALVDCYDALTSERPYKRAWSHQEAVEHLRGEGGTAYDPRIVEVFLRHEQEIAQLMSHVHAQA